MAAGFDYQAELITGLQSIGFGLIEIGSVSDQAILNNEYSKSYDKNVNYKINEPLIYEREDYNLGILGMKANLNSLRQ